MENQNKKVISIPLIYIIAVIGILWGIICAVRNLNNITQINSVAKIETENNNTFLVSSRNTVQITSRATETSRQEMLNTENNKDDVSLEEVNMEDSIENLVKEENNLNENEFDSVSEDVYKYIAIEELTISENMDLTERTNLSKEDFVELISRVKQDSSKFFFNNAETIYDLCEKYELNEIFFCGLISAESGWNIASNHRSTFNYISLMTNGKLKQFKSVEDGLEQAAKVLHEKYLTPGGKFYSGVTLAGVKKKFCPSSSTWTSLVYGRMKQIYNCK